MKKREFKILSVRELIKMLDEGTLHSDTTTQRIYLYNSSFLKKVKTDDGELTKAGYVIYNILEKDIQLPTLYFWYNTDTNQLNLHDGKQRSLSIYNFYRGNGVITIRHHRPVSNFNALSAEDQEALLNYQFGVQITHGTSEEEEESFYEINSNSVNLTAYENLRSVCYGPYMYSLEDYINGLTATHDYISPVNRGEQVYKFLLALNNINDSKQAGSGDVARKLLRQAVKKVREETFNPADGKFDLMLETFNELMRIKFVGQSKGLSEDTALAIAHYLVNNFSGRINDVLELYRTKAKDRNDILKWASDFNNNNLQTHKCFIDAYLNDGLELDPRRYFDDSEKDLIIKRDGQRCAHIDAATGEQCTETAYNKLEVDHVIPWSKGGRTNIDNAQLLCKHHNTSKGNRE